MNIEGKSCFPGVHNWIPEKGRFWIYMFFLLAFQFVNGMYFSAMNQMAGSLSLTLNDVKMMSYAMLIGQTMFFPLAFRIKFRFTGRSVLLTTALGIIACNALVAHTNSLPLLILLCFTAGFLRLCGTFECLTSLMPKIAPTHNYAVFLSFVFFIVLGTIHIFDIAHVYIGYYYSWQYIHYASIFLLGVVCLAAFVLLRPGWRMMPPKPLFGVDGFGLLLWSIFILSLIYVVQYGNQLNWLYSPAIRIALGAACLALGFNIIRMHYFRHPFLDLVAFKKRNLTNLLILFLLLGILLTSKNLLQNIFTGALLHFDSLNTAKFQWFEFLGSLTGAIVSYCAMNYLNRPYKLLTFFGMGCVVVYIAMMYFLISPHTNIEKLYLPVFFCAMGHLTVFITLTIYAQATTPLTFYFQILCILGLIRTGIASPIGDAIYNRALSGLMSKHLAALGDNFTIIPDFIGTEAMVASLRELFGWSLIFGVVLLVFIAISHFKNPIHQRAVSTMKGFYKKFYSVKE